jgi:hypothetical protein
MYFEREFAGRAGIIGRTLRELVRLKDPDWQG